MPAGSSTAPAPLIMAATTNSDSEAPRPKLTILRQPQASIKFRYSSEKGSHGCIYSVDYDKKNEPKTYPEVILRNYDGEAEIRASLVQEKNEDNHLHCLRSSRGTNTVKVSNNIARFDKLRIECKKREEVDEYLRRQHPEWNEAQLKKHKEKMNMNVVRIKFSAFIPGTENEICDPVYTNPISNKKSENALNIIDIVESADKRIADLIVISSPLQQCTKTDLKPDIVKVRMYTESEDGSVSWETFSETVKIIHSNIIIPSFPSNNNAGTNGIVSAYVQLIRNSDGSSSEPKLFQYTGSNASHITQPTPPMSPGHAYEVSEQNQITSESSSLVTREQNVEEGNNESLIINQNVGLGNSSQSPQNHSRFDLNAREYSPRYQTFKIQPSSSSSPTNQESFENTLQDALPQHYSNQQLNNILPEDTRVNDDLEEILKSFCRSQVVAQNVASGGDSLVAQEQHIQDLCNNENVQYTKPKVVQLHQGTTRKYGSMYQTHKTALVSGHDPLLSEGSIFIPDVPKVYLDKQRQETLSEREDWGHEVDQSIIDQYLQDAINSNELPVFDEELFESPLEIYEIGTRAPVEVSDNVTSAQIDFESGNKDHSDGPAPKKMKKY